MTMGNLLNAHAQELESMTRNVSGITPNYINIPDTRNDLSISEQAAQGKIYDMYVPHQWSGSGLKIIKVNSYVRHNFI